MNDAVERLAQRLQAVFASIAATRMADVPILNERLRVQAVDFEPLAAVDDDGVPQAAAGVLVTPWFMNLVWLPLSPGQACVPVGETARRRIGNETFALIGGHEPAFGAYEACSLFSPMFEFEDQAAAVATARAVMAQLRMPPASDADDQPLPAAPARRRFLGARGAPVPR